MSQLNKENLKFFKILYSKQYIQVIPLTNKFQTQILINKRTNQIFYEEAKKQLEFGGQFIIKYASLILGIVEIERESFLLFAEHVYLQPGLPMSQSGVYQIASISQIQFGRYISSHQKDILKTLQTEIFKFSFYFSFDHDMTLTLQNIKEENPKSRQPYFWNLSMLKAMMQDSSVSQWLIPVIQGHYSCFRMSLNNIDLRYYVISRRSKYRSGTRFYNRGIDQTSFCSQFVETQQIFVFKNKIVSFVIVSGSVPLFWEQRFHSDKVKLTRNKELTSIPFLEHLSQLKEEYQRVFIINLLEKNKPGQNLLLQAFEQLIQEHNKQLEDSCRYMYFNINQIIKTKNYSFIYNHLLHKIDPIIKQFGYFKMDLSNESVLSRQKGVFRLNCLDCLWRTNKCMQIICFYMLTEELYQSEIYPEHITAQKIKELVFMNDVDVSPLVSYFRGVWEEKADFESLVYTGSRATIGNKNKFLDNLEDSLISLQRFYNQKFNDMLKQRCLDIILYHKNPTLDTLFFEKEKIRFRLTIFSWNVNATPIEKLQQIEQILPYCQQTDIVVFGIQEMIELSTNNVVNNNVEESQESIKWGKNLEKIINGGKNKFIFVQKVEMVGLMLIVFISEKWKHAIKSVQKDHVKTGLIGQFGNKGAVILRIRIFQTTICLVNAHLSAGHSKANERVEDFIEIHKKAFQQDKVGVQNQAEIEESNYKFFFGDLNFRINGQFKQVKQIVDKCLETGLNQPIPIILGPKDQLTQIRETKNSHYLLSLYKEMALNFLPTYKLEKETGKFTIERNRVPSWCDRILYWMDAEFQKDCCCQRYRDLKIKGSDHRPILGTFEVIVQEVTEKKDIILQEKDEEAIDFNLE